MAGIESVLGLSLSESQVHAVEIHQDSVTNTLLAVDEWDNTLSNSPPGNGSGVDRFVEHLASFISRKRVRAKRVSIALDTSFLFINTIPVDFELSDPFMSEHLDWELQQYFPETGTNDFLTGTHVMKSREDQHWKELLTVSVRKTDSQNIQKILSRLGLQLHILDADHFSADTALRANYLDLDKKYVALVGVKQKRLDVTFVKYGNMECYFYKVVRTNREIVEQVAHIAHSTKDLSSVMAYGSYLDKDLLAQIRAGSQLLIEALNPFRHVNISQDIQVANHLSIPYHHFVTAVGVALRRD